MSSRMLSGTWKAKGLCRWQ